MVPQQISLWDNEALESGYHCMSQLKLEEAIEYFKEALKSPFSDKGTTQDNIEACIYWQPLIKSTNERGVGSISDLISVYNRFPFSRLMLGLRKALLIYFVEYLSYEPNMNVADMETVFDLLLKMKDFSGAENMLIKYLNHYPGNTFLKYFLAQAQWRNGNKASANDNYIMALLHHPSENYILRIENQKLQNLVHLYGPAMAPLYAWIQEIVPAISVINFGVALDEGHALAIRSLQLLRYANKALEENDLTSSINFRKQLKKENPELYTAYFNFIKQRKRN